MPTIVSRPATPTFIVSQPVVESPHPVTTVFGRSGDVVAGLNDYGITQINPEGAATGGIVVVESGQFVVKSLQIGDQNVQAAAVVENDIIFFDGNGWIFSQFPDLFNTVLPVSVLGVDAGEVLTFDGTSWVNFDLLGLIGNNIDNDIAVHTALTDVHGLIDSGAGTLFHSDDGSYKAVPFPAAPVASVFGRTGVVVAVGGDYAIADISGLTDVGAGTNFLADDGTYKTTPAAPVSSVFGRSGIVVAANNDYTLPQIDGLIDSGSGDEFLADDGTYKPPPGGSGTTIRQVVSPSIADSITIVDGAAHTTIFDFAPDSVYRNSNCLITIHYQAHNVPGNAQIATWIRSNIGLTIQQNSYNGTIAMDSNGDERLSFTVIMEGVVSAAGNMEIEVRSDGNDQDFSNNATNGKTRLTIELV